MVACGLIVCLPAMVACGVLFVQGVGCGVWPAMVACGVRCGLMPAMPALGACMACFGGVWADACYACFGRLCGLLGWRVG